MPRGLSEAKANLQISGPASPNETSTWHRALRGWRRDCLAELRLSDAIYRVPQLKWGRTAYYQPLMMTFDRYFYDDSLGNYTVARYLRSLQEQYSGIDSALLWPTYHLRPIRTYPGRNPDLPENFLHSEISACLMMAFGRYTNIGVDDRNQFQLIESQPGGVAGLRRVVDELHSHGVRVLWPYNPWVRPHAAPPSHLPCRRCPIATRL
jgi:iron(II)-dependent oxidoreductase